MSFLSPAGIACLFLETPTERQIHQIVELYRRQGWWQAADDDRQILLERLIAGSHCFVVAEEDGMVIGIGRAISDGVSDAYIQDVTVATERRGEGIAKAILAKLLERLHRDGIAWIGLIAEAGSESLYRHVGFQPMPGATPMLMIEER